MGQDRSMSEATPGTGKVQQSPKSCCESARVLQDALHKLGIPFLELEHRPVASAAEAAFIKDRLPGLGCKSLFLRHRKELSKEHGRDYILVCVPDDRRCDLRALAALLGTGRLSLATGDELEEHLGVQPGAVSPLALVNDRDGRVAVFFDRAFEGRNVLVHPLVNTKTLCLAFADLLRLLEERGRRPVLLDMPRERRAHPQRSRELAAFSFKGRSFSRMRSR